MWGEWYTVASRRIRGPAPHKEKQGTGNQATGAGWRLVRNGRSTWLSGLRIGSIWPWITRNATTDHIKLGKQIRMSHQ
ncbi:hypothetical protein PSYMO_30003 [Pseudomonas amygdali pv. mori str. 301020]|uniref:Uncharacterized protein n=1 Tax=Pseudomonas amygdali pv. mori str. 301020 TaxID=629261 RepID=A0A656GIV0_PSEA0|nr:hypothetical protein PSYMO_30003 [Pseudomonas amygdali pv. mori str. 301020]